MASSDLLELAAGLAGDAGAVLRCTVTMEQLERTDEFLFTAELTCGCTVAWTIDRILMADYADRRGSLLLGVIKELDCERHPPRMLVDDPASWGPELPENSATFRIEDGRPDVAGSPCAYVPSGTRRRITRGRPVVRRDERD